MDIYVLKMSEYIVFKWPEDIYHGLLDFIESLTCFQVAEENQCHDLRLLDKALDDIAVLVDDFFRIWAFYSEKAEFLENFYKEKRYLLEPFYATIIMHS